MVKMCLIAEHDPWDIQLLRLYVEQLGLRVVHVFEAQGPLPLVRQERPDVILLETELPCPVQCHDIICSLRSDPAANHTAIVLFSHRSERGADQASAARVYCLQKTGDIRSVRAAFEQAGVLSTLP